MKRRQFFSMTAVLGALRPARVQTATLDVHQDIIHGAGALFLGSKLIAHIGTLTAANLLYTVYTVGNAALFNAITLPVSCQMVLWGGAVLVPGVQYDVVAGGIKLRPLPLNAGDLVTLIAETAT